MNTHNICFYGEISKIIPYLSPNTLLICCIGSFVLLRLETCPAWLVIFFATNLLQTTVILSAAGVLMLRLTEKGERYMYICFGLN